MELSKQEIFNRVRTFLERYNDWVPTTFKGLGASVYVNKFFKLAETYGLKDPSLQSALALYIGGVINDDEMKNALQKLSKSLPTLVWMLPTNTVINQIKNYKKSNPQFENRIKDYVNSIVTDVGPIDAQSPFNKPPGVVHTYFEDLPAVFNYAINENNKAYNGKYTPKYREQLYSDALQRRNFMLKYYNYLEDLASNPLDLYVEYLKNPMVRSIIDLSDEETEETLLNILDLGKSMYYKTSIPSGGMKTVTNNDYSYIDQMKCGLNEDPQVSIEILNYYNTISKIKELYGGRMPDFQYQTIDHVINPNILTEEFNKTIQSKEASYQDTTTTSLLSQLWQKPSTKIAVGAAGIGGLALTSYGLYKLYQYYKQRQEAEEKYNQLKQQTESKKKIKTRRRHNVIINNLGNHPIDPSNYSSD